MKSNRFTATLLLVCIVFCLTACAGDKQDRISFTNDSGFELKIGMKKSDVEKAFNNSFENGKYYFVEDQNCCLVFIDNSLVYAEYGSGWKISKGPQMADEMTSLLDYFGDTESKAYILEPTDNPDVFNETYITLDYVFSDVRYSYNAGEDHVHISLVTSLDTKSDAEVIEKIKNDYYSDMYNEYAKTVSVIAAYGISNQSDSYYELATGTDKTVYEDLFGCRFENGTYYKMNPSCYLYFEKNKLAAYGVGKDWYWTQRNEIKYGQHMSEAIEKYGSPIAQKISKDGKNYAELVFDLDNGQRIACVSLTENSLIDAYVHFVFIIDGSSSVISLPEITE